MLRGIAPRRRYQGKGRLSTLLSVGHPAFRWTPCFQVDANTSGHQGGRFKMVPLYREIRRKHSWLTSIHCAAKIGNDTFIGMQALVFKAEVGNRVVVVRRSSG